MKPLLNYLLNLRNYKIIKKVLMHLRGGVVSLTPPGEPRGNVLLSYITLPFVTSDRIMDAHTNRWECREIARLFLERGYAVDVIDWTNAVFVPKVKYTYFIDIHLNMERIAPVLSKDCVKVLHATTSYWETQNEAEKKRLLDLKKRRGVMLTARRNLPSSNAIRHADFISLLGSNFAEETYRKNGGTNITRIPLSTTHLYPSPGNKDFESARKNFIWLGGSGLVHKGLDLVLEAFAEMPEYNLIICGKITNEEDFVRTYRKELYGGQNIKVEGLVDLGNERFRKICKNSVALIYPSCAEGQSGAVVTCMHAGLIPIVSYQSGVDVENFGITLKNSSVPEIKDAARKIASLPAKNLRDRAVETWTYARKNHTRERFSYAYGAFIDMIEKNKKHE